ncbi:LytTR family DNA-binding domain-containing protein [Roseibium sp.]|uniref:LytTR family DNA-binding domain-containing protein n=1 Tax=Roseibium sp. TaxID=1936156 RepID=UPI003A979D05
MSGLPIRQMAFLAAFAAALIAATEVSPPPGWSVPGLYVYWVFRIAIEAVIIIGTLHVAAARPATRHRPFLLVFGVGLATLIPFVLAVTAMDIVLGLPELERLFDPNQSIPAGSPGAGAAVVAPIPLGERVTVFLYELLYLLDNHLALSFLIATPWIFATSAETLSPQQGVQEKDGASTDPAAPDTDPGPSPEPDVHTPAFLAHLNPPFNEPLLRAEAQEHYVKLIGTSETRMLLYRFNDLVSQLPETSGIRVHRSHWVALQAADYLYKEGNNVRLMLKDGGSVPVSRRNAKKAESVFPTRP